ncbi:DUF3012 domain-containing protein [Neptuniibacter halophilus]|uniref:DUF3012 domain-containing protein n=1 Tax=Neptuniibacter halophilus TaxID=651666 RepID=UPI002573CFCC|nr:DUF3012 domain-containing protein [Neptuniibacter halophilus]
MKKLTKLTVALLFALPLLTLQGCSPEVGSKEWCAELKEKPKGDWSANELKDFTKHCIL